MEALKGRNMGGRSLNIGKSTHICFLFIHYSVLFLVSIADPKYIYVLEWSKQSDRFDNKKSTRPGSRE